MKTIWKFQLYLMTRQDVSLPKDAEVLSFAWQNGTPCVWALVDSDAPSEDRVVWIFGTGHPVPDDFKGKHIGSVQSEEGGALVLHAFIE